VSPPPGRWTSRRIDPVTDDITVTDEVATWRDYPYAKAPGDSDGTLALSDNRLKFTSARAGVMLDVDLDGFDSAEITGERDGRSLLTLHYLGGNHPSFWTSATVAQCVVDAVEARTR
jgi:hypothetical protein